MIAIVNVSKEVKQFGWQDYEIRINEDVITTFRHKREESLDVCLRKASEAVAKSRWDLMRELLESRGVKEHPDNYLQFPHKDF